jgi:hypothetical protein
MSVFRKSSAVQAAWLLLGSAAALACGPYFPNRILVDGDQGVLAVPVAGFRQELERLRPKTPPRFRAVVPTREDGAWRGHGGQVQQTARVDVGDLERALVAAGRPKPARDKVLAAYKKTRAEIQTYRTRLADWREKGLDAEAHPPPALEPPAIPDGLPAEFCDYLRGAILYHQGRRAAARRAWQALLDRPKAQRAWRSAWAAFMIGKSWLGDRPERAARWFRRTRQLAADGYADHLGLAAASLGWEARAELDRRRFVAAIELYVAQMATGDPTAVPSLQRAARQALDSPPTALAGLAANPTAREVLTAYVIARGGPYTAGPSKKTVGKWLRAVEAAKVSVVEEADRLAWAAYQIGDMDAAGRWAAVAPADRVMTCWVRAKLLLRAGKVEPAAELLGRAVRKLPAARDTGGHGWHSPSAFSLEADPPAARVRGELGALLLSRRQYVGALDALLHGGYWNDAAYVAERVLTADELKRYVDRAWPAAPAVKAEADGERRIRIRGLLARRLARLGRRQAARPYAPAARRPWLDAYDAALRDGNNRRLPAPRRAAALWRAACIARYRGIELLGTEVAPDWAVYAGMYKERAAAAIRSQPDFAALVPASRDEARRAKTHAANPLERFHYRYTAAGHAWDAAKFMPDDDPATARVLCIAGTWLKVRDPEVADRFYKALVIRCRRTKLGAEADRLRWFPKLKIDPDKLLPPIK